jgi:hypothetical protein
MNGGLDLLTPVAQLRDIRGLDAIPWWPPAPGWWLALAGALLLLLLTIVTIRHFLRFPPGGWRSDARRRLRTLRRALRDTPTKEVAGELSELLRRIGMARFGRRDCAGLSGAAWLDWLSEKDPSGFDWATQGQVLLRLPYAPEGDAEDAKAVRVLIDATLRLVSQSREDALRHRPAWLAWFARPPRVRPAKEGAGV